MILTSVIILVLAGILIGATRWLAPDAWLVMRATGRVCLTAAGIKLLAFLGASGAGVALMAYLVWNTHYLQVKGQVEPVAYLAYGAMLLLGMTQLSLHRLLGAKQAIETEFWKLKFKMTQGEDSAPPAA